MPDSRKNRGPHPEDKRLFSRTQLDRLQEACHDLSWLLNRGYAPKSSLKIVGDRHKLTSRQRVAISRCACDDQSALRRKRHEVDAGALADEPLWIDGYNILTGIEAALSGGVILRARDDCFRDLASMHGNYRKVAQTLPALEHIGRCLEELKSTEALWLLDKPVSNSGRLRQLMLDVGEQHSWRWKVELVPDPDLVLKAATHIVASSDSEVLNKTDRWFNLTREVIKSRVANAWIVDIGNST